MGQGVVVSLACPPWSVRMTTRKETRPLWACFPPAQTGQLGDQRKPAVISNKRGGARHFGVSRALAEGSGFATAFARSLFATSVRSHGCVYCLALTKRWGSQSQEGPLHTTVARNPRRRRSPAPKRSQDARVGGSAPLTGYALRLGRRRQAVDPPRLQRARKVGRQPVGARTLLDDSVFWLPQERVETTTVARPSLTLAP